ncbi:MAG: PilZ domain-containing protein [Pseudomonadota bacterium]
MTQQLLTEQRASSRKSMSSIVPVFDAMTGERLGHIGNISSGGLMVICQKEVGDGHLYQLHFSVPQDDEDDASTFNVGAHCLWCSEAESTGTFWAGFEIIDISDDEASELEGMVLKI